MSLQFAQFVIAVLNLFFRFPIKYIRNKLRRQFVKHPFPASYTLARSHAHKRSDPTRLGQPPQNKQQTKKQTNKDGPERLLSDILDLFFCLLAVMRLLMVSPCSALLHKASSVSGSAWKHEEIKCVLFRENLRPHQRSCTNAIGKSVPYIHLYAKQTF